MNLPGATAGAIDTMRAADNAVMLETVAVKLFPVSSFR
jgi:hypothetical protein